MSTEPQTVPVERFNEVVNERAALREELAGAKKQLSAAEDKAKTADTLARQIEEQKAEHKAQAARWEEERAVAAAGITDPDGVEVARLVYGRIPADKRPKTISEYLTSLKAEGAEVPTALSPWIQPVTKADPKDGKGDAGRRGAPPAPGKTPGGTAPGATPQVTAEAIRAAREKFMATKSEADRKALQELLTVARANRT